MENISFLISRRQNELETSKFFSFEVRQISEKWMIYQVEYVHYPRAYVNHHKNSHAEDLDPSNFAVESLEGTFFLPE